MTKYNTTYNSRSNACTAVNVYIRVGFAFSVTYEIHVGRVYLTLSMALAKIKYLILAHIILRHKSIQPSAMKSSSTYASAGQNTSETV